MNLTRRRVCLSLALLLLGSAGAGAQSAYPDKPIRLLVGFAPGGGSDIVARTIATPLGAQLGQSVIVDNKPGAGGMIAAEALAKAPPDGYTLLLVPSGHASGTAMKKTLPFDPVNDFAWVSIVTKYPMALSVAPSSAIQSFAQLLQQAKIEPGKYTYSSVGIGTAQHLVGEWVFDEAGVELRHVPFRGGTAPLTELLGGRVDVMIDTMTVTAPLAKNNRVRVIAVTAPKGASPLPGVPSVADQVNDVVYESWLGIVAPAATSAELVARLNGALRAVLDMPDVKGKLMELGGSPQASSPAEFKARVERDIARMRKIVSDRKIELQ